MQRIAVGRIFFSYKLRWYQFLRFNYFFTIFKLIQIQIQLRQF